MRKARGQRVDGWLYGMKEANGSLGRIEGNLVRKAPRRRLPRGGSLAVTWERALFAMRRRCEKKSERK